MTTEAEAAVMGPQVKGPLEPQKLEEAGADSCP